ncbi:hypothetical protein MBM_05958 [Drepanopeziza brunnea f. sp. 'multigermtubi' MB_m1]|uniref:Glycophorin A domain-containing protein n=1 Tax=Marssonina brunnea f. sp. multigermtubi (strain MB_m1) TaxID=1072389 RepID=K1WU07_MARBU|nr:uncharacterized protein MBM_05958 [Drepanopeziza brunnea f. sp. 'multigermtubi' MB_m1]EKD15947.1 hypothetical protein MBM_05958 [Drepanopeziza brunnea f. sp. 'multigermtubi' MB_m1]
MRLSQTPPSLLSLLFLALAQTDTADAGPFARDFLHDLGFGFLQPRECVAYCGTDNQYCCTAGQACYTNAGIAGCTATPHAPVQGAGGFVVYTTTWTETDLVTKTSTISYGWADPTPPAWVPPAVITPAICTPSLGQSSCGAICCASDQRCAPQGNTCTPYSSTYTGTPTLYSAPTRPTSGDLTAILTASVTATVPFIPAATASGSAFPIASNSDDGLSAGAIVGIVIGVIAGIILLLLLCFCCCVKAGLDGVLAIFGLGGKRKRRSTDRITVEEYGRRHSSGTAARRDTHSSWFGAGRRPAKVTEKRKKDSGLGGMGMVGAGLLGLAAVLGLKRKNDRRESRSSRTDYSSTYYTDSYTGTSAMQVQTGERASLGGREAREAREELAANPRRSELNERVKHR